jgi:DNA mismatch endonuclease (patch repair protein)
MSRIRGKNTKPEILVRKELHARGFRFRLYNRKLPGSPDIVLPKYGVAIMVNGCFWHGHEGCKYYVLPKTNTEFWKTKIERNRERDLDRRIQLRDKGWHVIQLWECQLKPKVREENLQGLLYTLNKIMLLNYQPKPYQQKEAPMTVAAENDLVYRKKTLSLSPETDKKA